MVILLMGVSGSGKTTIGKLLADQLGWQFADADSYHSAANVAKMAAGIPLTDEDRRPWLASLRTVIEAWIDEQKNVVLACSALKQQYREELMAGPEVKLVFLRGPYELIEQRLLARKDHYMNPKLLHSQFATLEEPQDAIVAAVTGTPEMIVGQIRKALGR